MKYRADTILFTDGQTDRRKADRRWTDGQTDRRTRWNQYNRFNFVEARGGGGGGGYNKPFAKIMYHNCTLSIVYNKAITKTVTRPS